MNDGALGEEQAMQSESVQSVRQLADILTGKASPSRSHFFPREGEPPIRLAADDARTVREAGARFASDLAGAAWAGFMLALAEQGERLRRAVLDAGHTPEQAKLAAAHFEAAARDEWVWLDTSTGSRSPTHATV